MRLGRNAPMFYGVGEMPEDEDEDEDEGEGEMALHHP